MDSIAFARGRSSMTITKGRLVFICSAAMVTAMCSSDSSPTSPTSTSTQPVATVPPTPTPTPTPTPGPPVQAAPGRLELHAAPNPVPFSGQTITGVASCANSRNTWFYDLKLIEVGGQTVTLRNRVDAFDGAPVNNLSNLNMVIPAYTSTTISVRWCSQTAIQHTAQTTFSGTDASNNEVKITSALVTLMKP
jgi:hypothetical protein